jgi:hypothetical protein
MDFRFRGKSGHAANNFAVLRLITSSNADHPSRSDAIRCLIGMGLFAAPPAAEAKSEARQVMLAQSRGKGDAISGDFGARAHGHCT